MRLTARRLRIIVTALAYWETVLQDGEGSLWHTEAEHEHLERERAKAFEWAHHELAKRGTTISG